MKKVKVSLGDRAYDILIGPGLLEEAVHYIAEGCSGQAMVVSDETVWRLHGMTLAGALKAENIPFNTFLVPPGEGSKSLPVLAKALNTFAESGLGRDGLVIAFGGGVVGDLAGFAASVWMRGVRYLQVPTTLLAMVDSSVGGKTAVNLAAGKNLAGTFWQPAMVAADTDLLETLPKREWCSGMAEMVKYGALFSPPLFEELAAPPDAARLPELVEACCTLKSATVLADERDTGRRMLLNFGHTFGHAVEKLGSFAQYNHGEAVAIGMVLAAAAGEWTGVTAPCCKARIEMVLSAHGLPTSCPFSASDMLRSMVHDKKAHGGGVDLILLEDIGKARVVWHTEEELDALLKEVLGDE